MEAMTTLNDQDSRDRLGFRRHSELFSNAVNSNFKGTYDSYPNNNREPADASGYGGGSIGGSMDSNGNLSGRVRQRNPSLFKHLMQSVANVKASPDLPSGRALIEPPEHDFRGNQIGLLHPLNAMNTFGNRPHRRSSVPCDMNFFHNESQHDPAYWGSDPRSQAPNQNPYQSQNLTQNLSQTLSQNLSQTPSLSQSQSQSQSHSQRSWSLASQSHSLANLASLGVAADSNLVGHKKTQYRKTKLCPWHRERKCYMGAACNYAHSREELQPKPDLSKTKLCPEVAKGRNCSRPGCRFAHDFVELRATSIFYKTRICKFWQRGHCPAGDDCRHAHGKMDLRQEPPPSPLLRPPWQGPPAAQHLPLHPPYSLGATPEVPFEGAPAHTNGSLPGPFPGPLSRHSHSAHTVQAPYYANYAGTALSGERYDRAAQGRDGTAQTEVRGGGPSSEDMSAADILDALGATPAAASGVETGTTGSPDGEALSEGRLIAGTTDLGAKCSSLNSTKPSTPVKPSSSNERRKPSNEPERPSLLFPPLPLLPGFAQRPRRETGSVAPTTSTSPVEPGSPLENRFAVDPNLFAAQLQLQALHAIGSQPTLAHDTRINDASAHNASAHNAVAPDALPSTAAASAAGAEAKTSIQGSCPDTPVSRALASGLLRPMVYRKLEEEGDGGWAFPAQHFPYGQNADQSHCQSPQSGSPQGRSTHSGSPHSGLCPGSPTASPTAAFRFLPPDLMYILNNGSPVHTPLLAHHFGNPPDSVSHHGPQGHGVGADDGLADQRHPAAQMCFQTPPRPMFSLLHPSMPNLTSPGLGSPTQQSPSQLHSQMQSQMQGQLQGQLLHPPASASAGWIEGQSPMSCAWNTILGMMPTQTAFWLEGANFSLSPPTQSPRTTSMNKQMDMPQVAGSQVSGSQVLGSQVPGSQVPGQTGQTFSSGTNPRPSHTHPYAHPYTQAQATQMMFEEAVANFMRASKDCNAPSPSPSPTNLYAVNGYAERLLAHTNPSYSYALNHPLSPSLTLPFSPNVSPPLPHEVPHQSLPPNMTTHQNQPMSEHDNTQSPPATTSTIRQSPFSQTPYGSHTDTHAHNKTHSHTHTHTHTRSHTPKTHDRKLTTQRRTRGQSRTQPRTAANTHQDQSSALNLRSESRHPTSEVRQYPASSPRRRKVQEPSADTSD